MKTNRRPGSPPRSQKRWVHVALWKDLWFAEHWTVEHFWWLLLPWLVSFVFLVIFSFSLHIFVNWQANLEEPCSARMALLLRYVISGYVTSHVQWSVARPRAYVVGGAPFLTIAPEVSLVFLRYFYFSVTVVRPKIGIEVCVLCYWLLKIQNTTRLTCTKICCMLESSPISGGIRKYSRRICHRFSE